ncbi:hypothetical protein CPB84DRAFT_1778757 [Gymnopilus junonius]|uniref:Uncharacterized protein n=1 Tax=Gymnopilus junonius TaxID=109634 RepID=A0A9P5NKT8_GYMJU|nr:hypothetical protein CPB84DRAFT_1778757 [Gymnopilus junonius]
MAITGYPTLTISLYILVLTILASENNLYSRAVKRYLGSTSQIYLYLRQSDSPLMLRRRRRDLRRRRIRIRFPPYKHHNLEVGV